MQFQIEDKAFMALPKQPVEKLLILFGSLLLSIWLMRETIALRNILLVGCSLLSFYYLYKNFQELFSIRKVPLKNWMPIILIGFLFIWVIIHLIFFSYEPVKQFQELRSTWLRGLMACVVGFAMGLIINRHYKSFDWIMLALISGFLILFYQYVGLVIETGHIFQQMWWTSIYWGKINEVLLGVIFLAGVLAYFENSLLCSSTINHNRSTTDSRGYMRGAIYILGVLLTLHCYVFEIDTRNGIGISVILILLFVSKLLWQRCFRRRHEMKLNWKPLLGLGLIVGIMFFFAAQQFQRNTGWRTYIEDLQISVQVDKSANWQSAPAQQIYSPDGRPVPMNTYERSAWMVVAAQSIPRHPLGYGLLHNGFGRIVKLDIPASTLTSSHNGWFDFGLSFGVVGLGLLLGSLLGTLALSINKSQSLSRVVLWISLGLLITYSLGELMVDHGMEFLLFWLIFLPTLLFPVNAAK
jgi:hypothetical protein